MEIVVQKFGGTSVSTEKNRLRCLEHIKSEIKKNHKVVVVVSAMGRNGDPYSTDTLLSLLGNEQSIQKRQLDFLLASGEFISASVFSNLLEKNNIPNIVLSGGQAGIITDDSFGEANIIDLKPERLLLEFEKYPVVIVPGFQGITKNGDITTLGRGGSDTSATAIGVSINALYVDIFTDVNGVMTADPRIVKEAARLEKMTYTELCNYAYLGAKVVHPRAVEMAMKKNIPIRIRSTFNDDTGTIISNEPAEIKERLITGITQTNDISQFQIHLEHSPVSAFEILEEIKNNCISIDFINLSNHFASFTVKNENKDTVKKILTQFNSYFSIFENCSKISIIGANIQGVPGVMATIAKTLQKNSIPILQTADSHTTIWVLVPEDTSHQSIQLLHRAFNLQNN